MLMVVFGAGASYDSANPNEHRRYMPLAKDLIAPEYNPIAAHYPASRAVISHVRRQMNDDSAVSLEHALANFEANAADNFDRQAQLVAFRFYLRELVSSRTQECLSQTSGYTHYLDLFNHLHDWQRQSGESVRIVTFNYDTLIENALETVVAGWRFTNHGDYLRHHNWKLIKLHGSVSWSRIARYPADGEAEANPDRAMELANQLQFDQEQILPFGPWTDGDRVPHEQVNIPALAVPMANKTRFECPQEHIAAVQADMSEVNRLLICGWRGAEHHAVELLNGINPGYYLGVVAGSEQDVSETIANLGFVGEKGVKCLLQPDGMTSLSTYINQLSGLIDKPW